MDVFVCVLACVHACVLVYVSLVSNVTEATLFGRYFSVCICDGCVGWGLG